MKKKCIQCITGILLLFLFQFPKSQAQTITEIEAGNRTYSQVFDSLSTGLIPSRIPYGILMNRLYGWAGLAEWNSGDTITASRLFQIWYDGEEAYINPANRPANYLAMRDTVDNMLYEVKLPVLAFAYQFGFIDSLATEDGRLTVNNGILTDNNNALPYFSKQVNIAGLVTEDVFQNKNYLLYFDQSIVFNNTAFSIQTITVLNLTTNSQFVLTANNGVPIQFATAGVNTLRFTIQLNNGSSYTTHQRINVKQVSTNNNIALRPVGPNCTPVSQLLTSDISFQGYAETVATNSHADVHYYYHTINSTSSDCERVLRKPIIIVDGFDPQNTRSHFDVYNENLSYLKNGNRTFLGDDLRDKGYDVIILNFPRLGSVINDANGVALLTIPNRVNVNGTTVTTRSGRDGGADYIERNAMLLVRLIQQVNATLAANGSTEKIVVVGPSMGGLISRYALSYMEKQQSLGTANMNHNCRVWVSFDSPHDGANIPPAIQQSINFLGYVAGSVDSRNTYENRLRSIAAQQQLIQQVGGYNSTSTFHSTFYSNLKTNGLSGSNGFPQNVRKVNLLNGVGNGTNTYSPGAEVLSGEAFSRVFGIEVKGFDIENNFTSLVTTPGQWQRTSYNYIILKVGRIPRIAIWRTSYVPNTDTRGSMDAVQGSLNVDVLKMLKDGIANSREMSKLIQRWYTAKENFCFIPTVSALGFKQPIANWHAPVNNRNLVCNNEINFDSYLLAPTNEKHIFLTEANVNWVMQEIEKGQLNCPPICSFELTGGAAILCENETVTYNLDVPVPTGYSVQWNVSSNFQLISSTNNSVTVQALSLGTASVNAVVVNPCGANTEISTTATVVAGATWQGSILGMQNYWNGLYTMPLVAGDNYLYTGSGAYYFEIWNEGTTELTNGYWEYISGDRASYGVGPHAIAFDLWWLSAVDSYYNYNFTDNCGSHSIPYHFMTSNANPPNGRMAQPEENYQLKLSPNPAANFVNISVVELGGNKKADSKIFDYNTQKTIRVYDKLGNLIIQHSDIIPKSGLRLNVLMLKPGDVYNVIVEDRNGLRLSGKLIKQ